MSRSDAKQIIAIGGGGFSSFGKYSPKNLLIEEYILNKQASRGPLFVSFPLQVERPQSTSSIFIVSLEHFSKGIDNIQEKRLDALSLGT